MLGKEAIQQESGLGNSDVNDTQNPRAYMTDDLLENYLKVGLPKHSIIALLGKPYSDSIQQRFLKVWKFQNQSQII